MDILEQRLWRFTAEMRPWRQSISTLGWMMGCVGLAWFSASVGDIAHAIFAAVLASLFMAVLYRVGQYTRLTLDHDRSEMRITQRSLIGQNEMVLPLHALRDVEIESVPLTNSHMRYRVLLWLNDNRQGEPVLVGNAMMPREEACELADAISSWLDTRRAAA